MRTCVACCNPSTSDNTNTTPYLSIDANYPSDRVRIGSFGPSDRQHTTTTQQHRWKERKGGGGANPTENSSRPLFQILLTLTLIHPHPPRSFVVIGNMKYKVKYKLNTIISNPRDFVGLTRSSTTRKVITSYDVRLNVRGPYRGGVLLSVIKLNDNTYPESPRMITFRSTFFLWELIVVYRAMDWVRGVSKGYVSLFFAREWSRTRVLKIWTTT